MSIYIIIIGSSSSNILVVLFLDGIFGYGIWIKGGIYWYNAFVIFFLLFL